MTPLEEKAKGNTLYAEGSFKEAKEVYEHAIARLGEGEEAALASVLHANAAACCFNLKDYKATVEFCTSALIENPAYHKAKLRRAMAYDALEQYEEAVKDLESLQESDFNDKRVAVLLRTCTASLEKQREAQKEEMLGKLKDLGNSILGNFGMSLDQFQAVQDPNTGSYSIQTKNQGASQ